jgi:uncharacterized protein with HEPN domain
MQPEGRLYLEELLQVIDSITARTAGLSLMGFLGDPANVDVVLKTLKAIRASAKRIPRVIQRDARRADWRMLIRLMDALLDETLTIDLRRIWESFPSHLDSLGAEARRLLDASPR